MIFKLSTWFCKSTPSTVSTKKYLKMLSETALHYRPMDIRALTYDESMKDRVVQTFFDTSASKIKVFEASNRLSNVK